MVQVQIDLPDKLDKKLKHLQIDEDEIDKRILIIKILEEHLDKCVD